MYDSLINQINAYIRDNATNDISGDGLNVILQAMLNALGVGMRFYGIATLNTVPAINQYPKFYIAFNPGFYSNFNIVNHPKFASGFAIIYDENGTNTWNMVVKPFQLEDSFLIDATVKDSVFDANTVFYIKEASKTNSSSSFSIQAKNKTSLAEQLVATYTYNGLLSGYKTHEIDTNTAKYIVSVNWDNVPLNAQEEFMYDDSKFPVTAYVKSSEDLDNQKMLERLTLIENVGGLYNVNEDATITRKNSIGATFYVDQQMTVDFLEPSTFLDLQNASWLGTNVRGGHMNAAYFNASTRLALNLKLSNFPAKTTYYIYIPNTSRFDHVLFINQLDANDNIISTSQDYTLHSNSMAEVCITRMENILYYRVTEFNS